MEKFSMISITIDVTTLDLSVSYNAKMDSREFLRNGAHRYILWPIIDHKNSDILRLSFSDNPCDIRRSWAWI